MEREGSREKEGVHAAAAGEAEEQNENACTTGEYSAPSTTSWKKMSSWVNSMTSNPNLPSVYWIGEWECVCGFSASRQRQGEPTVS